MPRISPVPSIRVSDLLVQSRLLAQMQIDQQGLFRLQTQVSTGLRYILPSEDAPSALRAINLQSLIERKDQVLVNIKTNQSYLSATDAALNQVAQMLNDVRGQAVGVVGVTASDQERLAVVAGIDAAIDRLLEVGNQDFRGRSLFAGSRSTVDPFQDQNGLVAYLGNEHVHQSFSDLDVLFPTSVHGNQVFGAISDPVRGGVDLNPVLTSGTLLSDLHGGEGIEKGSIAISDGSQTSVVDLSGATSIGDVARLIEAHPPAGRTVTVTITATGLNVELDAAGGGDLTINEVGGGRTAAGLGILQTTSASTGPVVGMDLSPRLRATTSLDEVLGSRASARLAGPSANNDLIFTANENGPDLNGVAIQLVDDNQLQAAVGVTAGNETAEFDAAARAARTSIVWAGGQNDMILTAVADGTAYNNVHVQIATQAGGAGLVNGAGASYDAGAKTLTITLDNTSGAITAADIRTAIEMDGNFTVSWDDSAEVGNAGTGVVNGTTVLAGEVANTSNSGGAANTLYINVQKNATRANQVAAAVTAQGIFTAVVDTRDALTAAQAGTGFVDLNTTATAGGGSGIQFDRDAGVQITNRNQTYTLNFSEAATIEDVLNVLNGSDAGLLAQINQAGDGIDVRSRLSGADFAIGENGGATAFQLGIRSFTEDTKLSDLRHGLGVDVAPGADFTITRSDGTSFDVDVDGALTIGDVLDLINNHVDNSDPATAVVARLSQFGNGVELVESDPSGPGELTVTRIDHRLTAEHLGLVPVGIDTASAALGEPLTGADVNPLETKGMFNALLRLRQALVDNDEVQIERAMGLLDDSADKLNFARAEVGARQQGLDIITTRLEDEKNELTSALSNEIDVDLTEAISEMTARQLAFQASLQTAGGMLRLTLLDFL